MVRDRRRDIERALEREEKEKEEDEPDPADIWEAAITGTHPTEMDTAAGAQSLWEFWTIGTDLDVDEMDEEEIEEFDQQIRETIEARQD